MDDADMPAARRQAPFVRRYLIGLLLSILAGLAYWATQFDPRVAELNEKLAGSSVLADYPYQFRVLALDNGVAVMTSPRSAGVGTMQFLRLLEPELADKAVLHPDMMAAQDRLVKMQNTAADIVSAEPDVRRIRWQLDQRWYAEHGVFFQE